MRHVLALALAVLAGAAPARAAVTVSLRVEGSTQTLYDGPVTTSPGNLDGGDGTGAHPCVGDIPGQAQATPAGALTSAGLSWRGTWFPDFDDFFLEGIGPDASRPPFAYWSLLVDWRYAQGACHAALHDGDEVLWAYDTAERPVILRLSGPAHVAAGEAFSVSVHDGWLRADGADGGAVAQAQIGAVRVDRGSADPASVDPGDGPTGPDGRTQLRFDQAGSYRLRATRTGAIASNTLGVCVGDADCQASTVGGAPPATGGNTSAAAGPATPPAARRPAKKTKKKKKKKKKTSLRCVRERAHPRHQQHHHRKGERHAIHANGAKQTRRAACRVLHHPRPGRKRARPGRHPGHRERTR